MNRISFAANSFFNFTFYFYFGKDGPGLAASS